MRRRFRPSLGRIEPRNKGDTDNAATSSKTTTPTPPIRRARIKPKVGIVGSNRSGCVAPRRDQAKPRNDPERSESRTQLITVTSTNEANAGPSDNVHKESTNASQDTINLQDEVPTDVNRTSNDTNQVSYNHVLPHTQCTDSENTAQEREKEHTHPAAQNTINSQPELAVAATNNEGNQKSIDCISLQTELTDINNAAIQREIDSTTLEAAQSTMNLQDKVDTNRTNNKGNQVSNDHLSSQTKNTSHDNAFQDNISLEGNSIVNASNEHSLSECETLSVVPEVQALDNMVPNTESDHCNNDSLMVIEQMQPCLPVLMDNGSPSGQTTRTIGDSQLPGILSCSNSEPNTQELSGYIVIQSQVSPSTFDLSQLQNADDLLQTLLQNASANSQAQNLPCEHDATTVSQQMASTDVANSESAVCNNRARQSGGSASSDSTKTASSSSSTTSSKLNTKRRYTKLRNRLPWQPTFRVNSQNRVPPNEFDIASNVVISDDLNDSDTPVIDHPVLQLPVDLIQNDNSQNSPKQRKNIKGSKPRFRQRNSGAVKVVVSRRSSESNRDSCSQEEDVCDLSKDVQEDSRKERDENVKRRKVSPNITHSRRKTKGKNQKEQSGGDDIVSDVGETSACCVIENDSSGTGNQSNIADASSFENHDVKNEDLSDEIVDSTLSNSVEVVSAGVVSASSDIGGQQDCNSISNNSVSFNELDVIGQEDNTCEPNLSSNVEVIDQGTANVGSVLSNTCVHGKEDQSSETNVPDLPNTCNTSKDDRQKSVELVAHRKRRFGPNLTQVRRKNKNTQSMNELTETGAMSQDNVGRVSEVSMVKDQDSLMTGSHSSNECESENNDCVTTVCVSSNNVEELPVNIPDDTLNEISGSVKEDNRQRERNIVSRRRKIEPNLSQLRRKNRIKDPKDVVEGKEVSNQDVGSLSKADLVKDQHSVTDISSLSSAIENCGPVVPDSSNNLEDISLSIPQGRTGEFLCNTDEPLLNAAECPECPEVLTSVTACEGNLGDGLQEMKRATPSGVREQMSESSAAVESEKNQHTAAGISGDSVSPSTTTGDPASEPQAGKGKKGKRVVKRGRKAKGKTVDGGVTEGSKGTEETREPEGSREMQVVNHEMRSEGTPDTQGSGEVQGVNEGSQLQDNGDPSQATESTSNESRGMKRKSKAVKPKVPAKRGRKKAANKKPAVVAEETGEEHEQRGTVVDPTSDVAPPDAQNKEENTTVQKKKGRGKSSKKSTNASSPCDITSEEVTSVPKKKGRRQARTGRNNTPVNISQMRISDMAYYNPKTNPMKEPNNVQETTISPPSVQNTATEVSLPADICNETQTTPVLAPQVTIDADGNIVLDEESLLIQSTAASEDVENREVVFENANQQYRASLKKRSMDRWKKDETVYFYEILSQVGTDFTLMAKLFPARDRRELKKKFKREEKINRDLIEKALNQRNPIPASLFAECLEETEEEMERALSVPPQDTVAKA